MTRMPSGIHCGCTRAESDPSSHAVVMRERCFVIEKHLPSAEAEIFVYALRVRVASARRRREMDVPQLLMTLGQQAQSSLWSQYYAQQNVDNTHVANGLDSKLHGQRVMEHLALQYWSALNRQQGQQVAEHTRSYAASPPAACGLGPEALLLLSQLQHIPGGAQALASYLASGYPLPGQQAPGQPLPAAGAGLGSSADRAGWPHTQQSPGGAAVLQQQAPAAGQRAPPYSVPRASGPASAPADATGCRAGSGSSASSEGDTRPLQPPLSR